MRKLLIIILSLIVLSGVGWYIYAKMHQTAPGVPSITDFTSFFPTGDQTNPGGVPGILPGLPSTSTTAEIATSNSPFKQISPNPVAGFTIFDRSITVVTPADPTVPKSKPTPQTVLKHLLRYVSRTNGYVYEIEDGSIPLQISNVYIPNIYEAVFGDKYETAVLRFLRTDQRTIATYAVPIPSPNPDGTRTQKPGTYLPDNLIAAVSAPDDSQVARIMIDKNGSLLSTSATVTGKKSDILSNTFREWILSWPNAKSLYLQTKASAQVPGYLYRVDTSDKKLQKVLGGITGLTASVSPSGTYVLYSQSTDTGFVTKLFNTKTNTTKGISLNILPEKCAWLKNEDLVCAGNTAIPNAIYPDAWYQGTVAFSDQLYRIYTGSLIFDTLYDNTSRSYDMTSLMVNESTNTVYFIDKPTGLLWQFSY